jgi:hypothetical protein
MSDQFIPKFKDLMVDSPSDEHSVLTTYSSLKSGQEFYFAGMRGLSNGPCRKKQDSGYTFTSVFGSEHDAPDEREDQNVWVTPERENIILGPVDE